MLKMKRNKFVNEVIGVFNILNYFN